MDLHAIEPGEDFQAAIQRAVANCSVLLVLIGPDWATITGPTGRPRLDSPTDLVRVEVATALRDPHTLVIPVLVERATMPHPADLPRSLSALPRRQALELGQASFQHDIRLLLDTIERRLRPGTGPGTPSGRRATAPPATAPRRNSRRQAPATHLTITRVGPVEGWTYRWPEIPVERYPTTTRYRVADDDGDLDVLVARGTREAFGRADRGRIVVFGNLGGASNTYYPWTEFVETDDGDYAAKLYNPADPRKSLRDGDGLPPHLAGARVLRNDAVFRSIRTGPALRSSSSPATSTP